MVSIGVNSKKLYLKSRVEVGDWETMKTKKNLKVSLSTVNMLGQRKHPFSSRREKAGSSNEACQWE